MNDQGQSGGSDWPVALVLISFFVLIGFMCWVTVVWR